MEAVREAAEAAVQGLPGVKGAFASLRRPPAARRARRRPPTPGRPQGAPAPKAQALPGREARHRRRLRQGRRRQVDGRRATSRSASHAHGLKVGLLDADIYGPSMPRLFGIARQAASRSTAASSSRSTATASR